MTTPHINTLTQHHVWFIVCFFLRNCQITKEPVSRQRIRHILFHFKTLPILFIQMIQWERKRLYEPTVSKVHHEIKFQNKNCIVIKRKCSKTVFDAVLKKKLILKVIFVLTESNRWNEHQSFRHTKKVVHSNCVVMMIA